jgi:predicted ArsR family transcriptional regulator
MITSGSKKQILDLIKRQGTLRIDEAVKRTNLAKTTLREHFLQLERDGYITRDYVRSGPGRPSLQYALTQKGHSLYPSQESNMLRELIRFLDEKGSAEEIEQFFTSFWDKRFDQASRLMERASDQESKLKKLGGMLEEEGFMPKFESDDDTIMIKECNCPFSEVVKETRLPCKLEAEFYGRLFEGEVNRTSFIADGDHSCSYCITTK